RDMLRHASGFSFGSTSPYHGDEHLRTPSGTGPLGKFNQSLFKAFASVGADYVSNLFPSTPMHSKSDRIRPQNFRCRRTPSCRPKPGLQTAGRSVGLLEGGTEGWLVEFEEGGGVGGRLGDGVQVVGQEQRREGFGPGAGESRFSVKGPT